MRLSISCLLFSLCCFFEIFGQAVALPTDFRQHNLTQFNSSLFSPTFSLEANRPRSVSLWSRWQWQTVDGTPTTVFANYTQNIDSLSALGVGFFQHNTGVLLNTGGLLNYAFAITGERSKLIFGANVLLFSQKLADEGILGSQQMIPLGLIDNDFIAEFTPALEFQINRFSIALAVENALNFNFSDSERTDLDREFTAIVSNTFPILLFGKESSLKPVVYLHTVPDNDTQLGLNTVLNHPNFWIQGGYNSFYGASGGAGITLFKKFSLGALAEFGVDESLSDRDPSIEVVLSYFFGRQKFKEKEPTEEGPEEEVDLNTETEKEAQLQEERLREQARQDSIGAAKQAQLTAARKKRQLDSIAAIEKEALLRKKQRLDSIAGAKSKEEVTLEPNEKYQEVAKVDGLVPGFYLIANVFGTKEYFEKFMKSLFAKGLEPKSFYRDVNGYNYVYLKRYSTIEGARKARDSNFNGRYRDALWIFRVRGN